MNQQRGHVFFQDIHQRQQEVKQDSTYLHNCMVFEMASNWPWIRWMMDRFRTKELKEVDPLERDWLNFVLQNKIDVEKYGKDENKFVEEYFKKTDYLKIIQYK